MTEIKKVNYQQMYTDLLKESGKNYVNIVDVFLILCGINFFISLFQIQWILYIQILFNLFGCVGFSYIRYRILKKQQSVKALDSQDKLGQ